jgi:hypothetical protein
MAHFDGYRDIIGKEILQHLALEEMKTKQWQNLQTLIMDQNHIASSAD